MKLPIRAHTPWRFSTSTLLHALCKHKDPHFPPSLHHSNDNPSELWVISGIRAQSPSPMLLQAALPASPPHHSHDPEVPHSSHLDETANLQGYKDMTPHSQSNFHACVVANSIASTRLRTECLPAKTAEPHVSDSIGSTDCYRTHFKSGEPPRTWIAVTTSAQVHVREGF